MKKRLLCALLALCLAMAPVCALAAGSGSTIPESQSGFLSLPKLSKSDIYALLSQNPLGYNGAAMAQPASVTAPYATGQVSDTAVATALGRFNVLRRLAGLGEVTLDNDLAQRAQYGAVLLAATGELTHHPVQPADMDNDFYQRGHNAASSSNIYMGTNATLPQAVEAFFNDSDAGNLPMVGHRRWMLNPEMGKTGLGFSPSEKALGELTYNFATLWAFDRSAQAGDYDFISWPASGYFPSSLFVKDQAWSVTLNPGKYALPTLSELAVTLTRIADGKRWNLSGSQSYTPADKGAYLGVDAGGYGVANAIIFRPELDKTRYEGAYTVTIQGLRTVDGQSADLAFRVEFFDLGSSVEPTPTAMPTPTSTPTPTPTPTPAPTPTPTPPPAGELTNPFLDVPQDAWYTQAVLETTQRGLFNGTAANAFSPDGTMTRTMVMTVLARLDGVDTAPRAGESWDIRGRRWAVTNRISDGLEPSRAITLEELAKMLYSYAQLRYNASPASNFHLAGMPDGNSVSSWAAEGTNWAVDRGILIGDESGRLNPQRTATRAQVAILLQRFLSATGRSS